MLNPLHVVTWLVSLEAYCGWSFLDGTPDLRGKEHPVSSVVLPDGGHVPFHMMDARYTPDVPNPRVDRIRERIARKRGGRAILTYTAPAFWSPDRVRSRRGMLLGGSLLEDGRWTDFVLTTTKYGGKGVADVFGQVGLVEGRPTPGFVARYGFDTVPDLAVLMAGEMAGIDRSVVAGDFLGTEAGWAITLARHHDRPPSPEVVALIRH